MRVRTRGEGGRALEGLGGGLEEMSAYVPGNLEGNPDGLTSRVDSGKGIGANTPVTSITWKNAGLSLIRPRGKERGIGGVFLLTP